VQAYVVRVIQSRMIVGFFCTDSMIDLHYWVDSVADPGACEYHSVESGGVVWEGESPVVPFATDANSDDDDDEEQRALAGVSLTESWSGVLFDSATKWRAMGPMQYGPAATRSDAS
jgi:hypothetical protein